MSYTNERSEIFDQLTIFDLENFAVIEENPNLTDYDETIAEKMGTIFKDSFDRIKPMIARTISAFKDKEDFENSYKAWLEGEKKGKFYNFVKQTFKIEDEDCYHHMNDRAKCINNLNQAKEAAENAACALEDIERQWDMDDEISYWTTTNKYQSEYESAYAEKELCGEKLVVAENDYANSLFSIDELNTKFGL